MHKLWKFASKVGSEAPKIETYEFTATEDIEFGPEEESVLSIEESDEDIDQEKNVEDAQECNPRSDPVSYAQMQSECIIQDAKAQAEQIIREAEEQAQKQIQEARQQAVENGYKDGFQQGIQEGTAKAMQESMEARAELAQQLSDEVEAFLEKGNRALDKQLDDNLDDLRDLALAVAEKVICISLKSSSDVIGRMIQTAVDKRKRREWVHIYISECDAKRLTTLPPALTAALAELSDRVRIIPMADDEEGTCIIECPDEIIDASAATQVQNIREMLSHQSASGVMTNLNFTEK